MNIYNKTFSFNSIDENSARRKIQEYFKFYGFKTKSSEDNTIFFYKKYSIFEGWKINPLNWESQVHITFKNNSIFIKYTNEGAGQLTPFAFDDLFISFFKNLELYLDKSISFKLNNELAIKKAKKKLLIHFLVILTFIVAFWFLARLLKEKFSYHYLSYFMIFIGAYGSQKLINQYWINKTS